MQPLNIRSFPFAEPEGPTLDTRLEAFCFHDMCGGWCLWEAHAELGDVPGTTVHRETAYELVDEIDERWPDDLLITVCCPAHYHELAATGLPRWRLLLRKRLGVPSGGTPAPTEEP